MNVRSSAGLHYPVKLAQHRKSVFQMLKDRDHFNLREVVAWKRPWRGVQVVNNVRADI